MSSEDAKRVKNKEHEDDENDEKALSSLIQNKNKKPKSLSLKDAKLKKLTSNPKKEEEEEKDSDDEFLIKKKVTASAEKVVNFVSFFNFNLWVFLFCWFS